MCVLFCLHHLCGVGKITPYKSKHIPTCKDICLLGRLNFLCQSVQYLVKGAMVNPEQDY